MHPPKRQTGNRLLDHLPKEEFDPLAASWEPVSLPQGQEIFRQDAPIAQLYFPLNGLASIVVGMEDGGEVEAAAVGNEGVIGLPAVLGLDFSPATVVWQIAGQALRLPVSLF